MAETVGVCCGRKNGGTFKSEGPAGTCGVSDSLFLSIFWMNFCENFDVVSSHRGMGFMQGLVLTIPVADVVRKALENGLVVLSAGENVLRFLPPLIAEKEDFDRMKQILTQVLKYF